MTAAPRVAPPVATPPVVGPPATDLVAPAVSLAPLARTLALRRTLTRGVRVTLTVGEPGRAVVRLLLSRADARRLGINRKAKRAVVIGKVSRMLAAGQATVSVKLTRRLAAGSPESAPSSSRWTSRSLTQPATSGG